MKKNLLLNKLLEYNPRITNRLPDLNNQKVLVLAPHPDDETIGCGGTVLDLIQKGICVQIVLITDGSGGNENKELSAVRLQEFEEAMKLLHATKTIYLGFQDGHLDKDFEKFKCQLTKIIYNFNPDIIFSPYLLDYHKDHKTVAFALADCLEKVNNIFVAMYEIWTPILYPNCYLNITQVFEKKLFIARSYASQERHFSIIDKFITLNSLRAKLSMWRNVEFVEAFKCFSQSDYIRVTNDLKKQLF